MSSFEEIGALLGFVAFAGLAVLVFLTFQQGRHLRRLRDWAGRAPERAAALAARGEPQHGLDDEEISDEELEAATATGPSRLDRFRESAAARWSELDRRMPVDPKLLFGGLAAVVLGVGIATSGFGLFGDQSVSGGKSGQAASKKGGGNRAEGNQGEKPPRTVVAVLNGTAPPGGVGVVGIADRVSEDVVGAGFKVGAVDNAGSFATSTVMWSGSPDAEAQAQELADALEGVLGTTTVVAITPEIETLANGAEVVLIVGQDDATI